MERPRNVTSVRIGEDPWPNIQLNHLLPLQLIHFLQQKGLFHINQIVDPASTNLWKQGWLGYMELYIPSQWN